MNTVAPPARPRAIRHAPVRLLAASLGLLGAVWGCDDGGPGDPAVGVHRVEITPASVVLAELGATALLTATALDATGEPVPGARITWSSQDDGVATVDASGLVTGLSRGTTNVQASADEVVGLARIGVDPDTLPPRLVSVSLSESEVNVFGRVGSLTVTAELTDDRTVPVGGFAHFQGPAGAPITGVVILTPVEDRPGRLRGPLSIPPNSAEGTWRLSLLQVEDRAGNRGVWQERDLEGLGLALTFEVVAVR